MYMKPFAKYHFKKPSDFSNPGPNINVRHGLNNNDEKMIENVESMINNDYTERCTSQLEPTSDINTNTLLDGQDESSWSYESYGFRSLPTRGYKKNRRPGIKFMINSDTVSQTKVLMYKDHHKSLDKSLPNSIRNVNGNLSKSDSSNSLNSNNDPEIVAAIDQIASQMGLIEQPVMRRINDPVNYILSTRSFSERISIHRPNSENNYETSGDFSRSDHLKTVFQGEPNTIEEDIIFSYTSPKQKSVKKQSKISKFIQKCSPKLSRKSKGSSTYNSDSSNEQKLKNNESVKKPVSYQKNVVQTTTVDSQVAHDSQKTHFDETDTKIKLQFYNDNYKKVFNSLHVDRIESPYDKFRSISSKRKTEENHSSHVSNFIIENVTEKNIQTTDTNKDLCITTNRNSLYGYGDLSTENSKYIRTAICAYGYGPHQCIYKSPIGRRSEISNETKNDGKEANVPD